MSGYTNFAVIGAGNFGNFIIQQLLKDKAAGTVKKVVVLTRQGSKTTVQGDAKVIQVDYSKEDTIKQALADIHVVISTIQPQAIDVQTKIAAAAKEVGVQLFCPSEFGGISENETEGIFAAKVAMQNKLKAMGLPYAAFYNGPFSDMAWVPPATKDRVNRFVQLDVLSGKVTVAGDGNKQISFTSRPDAARYITYVLTHLPAEQLKNRRFSIAGDNKSFNEIFKAYEEKTGKKIEVTYIPVSELDAKIAANPGDVVSYLQRLWAIVGPFPQTDNHLYPDWNPSTVLDNMPVA